MEYDSAADTYICRNGKKLEVECVRHAKSKTGYVSEKRFINVRTVMDVLIRVNVSRATTVKHLWKKGQKLFRLQKHFWNKEKKIWNGFFPRKEFFSEQIGVYKQRGSFGDLKQDMQFRRYLSKGTSNVLAESTLLAMAKT